MSRIEHDFLGQREIADDLYYGVQTVRGFENFDITGIPMSREPSFVKAFGYVKKAAAMARSRSWGLGVRYCGSGLGSLRQGHRRDYERSVYH